MSIKDSFNKVKKSIMEELKINEKSFQLILFLVIIFLVNIISTTKSCRLDLTKNETYSLTDESQQIVSDLNDNLTIKVLFSEDLPPQHVLVRQYLVDLLKEYKSSSNKYFNYEIIADKDLEKVSQDYGVSPVQSQELANDQVKIRRAYMGLVFQYSDLIEKINAVTNTVGLEYEITSLIQKMSSKETGLLALKESKKNLKLNLFLDSNIMNLPIDGVGKLEEFVKKAYEVSKEKNYGVLEFKTIDPSVENKTDEVAKKYGLQKIKWEANQTKAGQMVPAGEGVMGIVLESDKKFEVINIKVAPSLFGNYVITGIDQLEDRINEAVARVISSNLKVGYITGHGEVDINDERQQQGAGVFKNLLDDIYNVETIDLTKEEISEDFETIIINGPNQELKEYEAYKIDQFLMRGKSVILFVNSFKEMQMPGQQNMFQQQPMIIPVNTGLENLMKHYGVTVNKDIVLDKSCPTLPVSQQMMKEVYFLPMVTKKGLSDDHIITRYLQGVAFIKSSSITVDDNKLKKLKVQKDNLVSSSDESWLMKGRIQFNPMMIPVGKDEEMKQHVLSVALKGKFESYYKNKEKPVAETEEAVKGNKRIQATVKLNETVKERDSKIVVVGSSEITTNYFINNISRVMEKSAGRSEINSNGLFLRNMVDYLNGNESIPEMRSKSLNFNPLEKLSNTEKLVYKTVNIAGVPIFIVLIGLFIWRSRLARRKQIQREFSGEVKGE